MLDLRVLRDNFKTVADALKKRGKQIELDAVMHRSRSFRLRELTFLSRLRLSARMQSSRRTSG